MKTINTILTIFVLMCLQTALVSGQDAVKQTYTVSAESELSFDGTSTLHDWKCEAIEIQGTFLVNTDGQPASGKIVLPIMAFKSEKGDKMDKKMREALNAEDHPEITFTLTGTSAEAAEKSDSTLKVVGDLTVNGVTKSLTMDVSGVPVENGAVKFSGSKELRMTDFDVKPPKMFLGTLRTGNEVTVNFTLVLTPEEAAMPESRMKASTAEEPESQETMQEDQ